MASYADALRADGDWLLRIEDVDVPRARRGAADAILATLEMLGFEWQGDVWRQSDRTGFYEHALGRLRERDLIYACACTRSERAHDKESRIGERVYPGVCAHGIDASRASRKQRAVRVRVPAASIEFVDRVQGRVRQRLVDDVGDFIVRRSDGLFAYQLAVVVDDGAQGVTDVVRGADLLASTPRQIFLQQALNLPTPRYLHVPVAIDVRGRKLSKQTDARALPDAPLASLLDAWRFLDQAQPIEAPATVGEFWRFARMHWQAARVPPVPMLPAPPAYN